MLSESVNLSHARFESTLARLGLNIEAPYLDAFKNIVYVFSQKHVMDKMLSFLEKQVAMRASKQQINSKELTRAYFEESDTSCYKLLSGSLKSWLISRETLSAEVVQVRDFLSSNDFFSLLSSHQMLKDIGAGPAHGEWTHFMQWYFVSLIEPSFNGLKIEDLMDYLASESARSTTVMTRAGNPVTLWDVVFDRQEREISGFSFSCPEFVNSYIMSNKMQLPLLSVLLLKRHDKRVQEKANANQADSSPNSISI